VGFVHTAYEARIARSGRSAFKCAPGSIFAIPFEFDKLIILNQKNAAKLITALILIREYDLRLPQRPIPTLT
jgi:hypothetical protein